MLNRLYWGSLYFLTAFLIATEGIFAGYKIGPIDFHRLAEFVVFLFVFKYLLRDLKDNRVVLLIFQTTVLLYALLIFKFFVLLYFKNEYDPQLIHSGHRLVFLFIYMYLVYYFLQKRHGFLKLVLLLAFPLFLVAFLQFNLIPFNELAWELKLNYFNQNTPPDFLPYQDEPSFRSRLSGLYGYAIPLAYAITAYMLLTLYVYVKENSLLFLVYFLFLVLISIISLTRSTALAGVALLVYFIYMAMTHSTQIKKLAILSILAVSLLAFVDFYASQTQSLERLTNTEDGSATGRIPLALTGLYNIVVHPLGASEEETQQIKKEMFAIFHHRNILYYPSHNGLIELGIQYTSIGVIIFVVFLYRLKKMAYPYLAPKLRSFFSFSLLAYFINSFFHNAFMFTSDFFIMSMFAVLAYEYKIAEQRHGAENLKMESENV
jgi:hypothetical protein